MLLVIPRHALNVPLTRWGCTALGGLSMTGFDLSRPAPIRSIIFGAVAAVLLGAWALAGTFYLRARAGKLLIATVYRRSSLLLAGCWFDYRIVGRVRYESAVVRATDGETSRDLRTYFAIVHWSPLADFAVWRLTKLLLPPDPAKTP